MTLSFPRGYHHCYGRKINFLSVIIDGVSKEKTLNPEELERQLISEEWRQRFAALHQMGVDKTQIDRFIKISKDPKMHIRRLAVVYIGLMGGKKACEPLCEAL